MFYCYKYWFFRSLASGIRKPGALHRLGSCVPRAPGRVSAAPPPLQSIRHPASCILHPVGWAGLGWAGLGWLAGLGWWLAGGWLVVGWWLVGGWLVVGWWLAGTRHRNATLGECSFAAGCWLLVAGCWLLVAGCWLLGAGKLHEMQPSCYALAVYTKRHFSQLLGS
jgi:hypothetical protein